METTAAFLVGFTSVCVCVCVFVYVCVHACAFMRVCVFVVGGGEVLVRFIYMCVYASVYVFATINIPSLSKQNYCTAIGLVLTVM